jgi:hypothetical protein
MRWKLNRVITNQHGTPPIPHRYKLATKIASRPPNFLMNARFKTLIRNARATDPLLLHHVVSIKTHHATVVKVHVGYPVVRHIQTVWQITP